MTHSSIVVVLDGGSASREAVRWAAAQSQEQRTPLEVVYAYPPAGRGPTSDAGFRMVTEEWHRARATAWLREALDESPALPYGMHLDVTDEDLSEHLRRRLRPGGLLVVGSRSSAAVISSCMRQSSCPVVLVPPPRQVGTDLSTEQPSGETPAPRTGVLS
jgi:nucleotide-binding universal stress UspA family protein